MSPAKTQTATQTLTLSPFYPVLIALMMIGGVVVTRAAAQDIGYEQALQLAAETQRPVMLYFHSDTCDYCEYMSQYVFPKREVARVLKEQFVMTTINTSTPQGEAVMREYRVMSVPSFLVLGVAQEPNAEGDTSFELMRLMGSRTPPQFLNELSGVTAQYERYLARQE